MKLKRMNKGFTLIEVCIASAILAIALSPFVANFVQASKMNYKARKDLNAMNLAQDMYEGMSVYTQSEFNALFADLTKQDYKKILPKTATCTGATGGPATDGAGVPIENVYTYKFTGVKTADTVLNTYDVDITVDGSSAKVGRYSKRDYAEIHKIDGYYDATFVMPATELDSAIAEVKDESKDAAAYVGKLKRTITLNIENKGSSTNPNYSVTVDRKYEVATDQGTLGNKVGTLTGTNLMKADPAVAPRNVYLYYEGIPGTSYNNVLEDIRVKNTTGEDVTVYLIRTIENKSAYEEAEINYNRDYGCEVHLSSKETDETDEEGNPTGKKVGMTYLVSNLRFDLCAEPQNNFRIYKEGSSTEFVKNVKSTASEAAEENKDYKYSGDSKYNDDRAKYYYDPTGTDTFTSTMDEATYTKLVSDGYKLNEDVARAYDVTITITETGTNKHIAEYTGGIID